MNERGLFIAIEGLDGAGTTTQATMLAQRLRDDGEGVHLTREPSDGPIGTMIRQMLSMRIVGRVEDGVEPVDREVLALLFAADRLDHISVEIEPALADETHVITDRYYHSSFAYQGDIDDSDDVDISWVRTLNERARRPDVTFFLEVSPETCLERMAERSNRDIYESEAKMRRLARRYDEVMSLLDDEGEKIVRIDGTRGVDEIHAQIRTSVDTLR